MPRILVVDDETFILDLLAHVLVSAGYEVDTAASGEAAMELCRSHTYALLLSDVRMPGIDGHQLARWVAENYPDTKTALMSGYGLRCEHCPYSPRCKTLEKPFRPGELLHMVRGMVG